MTGHFFCRPVANAAASWGLRSRASLPLPGLDLDELGGQVEAFGRGKPGDGLPLGLDAKP